MIQILNYFPSRCIEEGVYITITVQTLNLKKADALLSFSTHRGANSAVYVVTPF